jgi:hypothetical protein
MDDPIQHFSAKKKTNMMDQLSQTGCCNIFEASIHVSVNKEKTL